MDRGQIVTSLVVVIVGALVAWLQQRNLSKFNSDLQRRMFEYQTRYAKLHESRAKVVAELYKRLARTQRDFVSLMQLWVSPGAPTWDDKVRTTVKGVNDFWEYLDDHRLFFDDELSKKLDGLHKEYFKTFLESTMPKPEGRDTSDQWFKRYEKITVELDGIRSDITKDFQKMLGVEDQAANLTRKRETWLHRALRQLMN